MDKIITVDSYPSRIEAEVAKGFLQSEGVKSFIEADDSGGMYPYPMSNRFGVQLKVLESQFKIARKLLDTKFKPK